MRILYLGPYRQSDGWGQAALDLVKAFAKSHHDVAIRPLYLANNISREQLPHDVQHMEHKRLDLYDILIQQAPPNAYSYDGRFKKNVGMFFSETGDLSYTPWISRSNLMDELWVSSEIEKSNLIKSGVTKPIKVLHVPVDTSKFEKAYDKLLQNTFIKPFNFYYVGEYVQRKNLPILIAAFHLEFGTQEPVNLVIKTNRGGTPQQHLNQMLADDINSLKQTFRIYGTPEQYKQEIIITDFLSDMDMNRLHASCDCFVMPSHGEAWCRPALDAMGFGNPCIVTSHTGMQEFVNNENGWIVESTEAPCLCAQPPLPYLYTSRETWRNPAIASLRKAMREAYENKDLYKSKKQKCIEDVYQYSYEKVGEQLNALC